MPLRGTGLKVDLRATTPTDRRACQTNSHALDSP